MPLPLHPTSSRQHSRDICQCRAAALSICVAICAIRVSAPLALLLASLASAATSHNSDLLSQIVDELGALLSGVVEQFPHRPRTPPAYAHRPPALVQLTLAAETHNLIRTLHTHPYPRHTHTHTHQANTNMVKRTPLTLHRFWAVGIEWGRRASSYLRHSRWPHTHNAETGVRNPEATTAYPQHRNIIVLYHTMMG